MRMMEKFGSPLGVPRKTKSLCPQCGKKIDADIVEKDGKVIMEKTCPEHGYFWDVLSIDPEFYKKMESFAHDGVGVSNPMFTENVSCPESCGMCTLHKTHTNLAIVDLTNRCNLKCPICFANANEAGYVFEPDFDQISFMLKKLRDMKPMPAVAVQFSGGEPTLHPEFFKILEHAVELGFVQTQIATNGIRLASDPKFAQACVDAGLHTVYLQFDGLKDDNYRQTRGVPLMEIKKKAIDNCRKVNPPERMSDGRKVKPRNLPVVLVPTIVKTINEDQVVPILDFALENIDVVRGINYQPVALTGRIPQDEVAKLRYTQSELVHDLMKDGRIGKEDWFPVPVVAPISALSALLHKAPKITFTSHPDCGVATFLFIEKGKVIPLPRFMDIEGFMEDIEGIFEKHVDKKTGRLGSIISGAGMYRRISKYFDFKYAPSGLNDKNIVKTVADVFSSGNKEAVADFTWETLFVGSMHFQDHYNYDIDRVMRCAVHYTSPDGRIIPFCAYNGGPTYRTEVEKKFAVPIAEWRAKKKTEKGIAAIGLDGEACVEPEAYLEEK